jgi:hypothetical protein
MKSGRRLKRSGGGAAERTNVYNGGAARKK